MFLTSRHWLFLFLPDSTMASRVGLRAETWTTKETHHASDSEPFVFNESHHSARLLDGLCHLRDCSQLFDVTLIAEEQEFPAHRVVLASCSDYFHAMFTNGLRESSEYSIMLSGVTASALEQLIHFAYTSKLKITKGMYYVWASFSVVKYMFVLLLFACYFVFVIFSWYTLLC